MIRHSVSGRSRGRLRDLPFPRPASVSQVVFRFLARNLRRVVLAGELLFLGPSERHVDLDEIIYWHMRRNVR